MSEVDIPIPQWFYSLCFKFIPWQSASSGSSLLLSLFPSGRLHNVLFNPGPEHFVRLRLAFVSLMRKWKLMCSLAWQQLVEENSGSSTGSFQYSKNSFIGSLDDHSFIQGHLLLPGATETHCMTLKQK